MRAGRILEYSFDNLHQNLALEHVILHISKESSDNTTIRFWKNPPSVILGRSQLLDREVNIEYCKQNNIVIGRRISGGGTVYQDFGNLNTSLFIKKKLIAETEIGIPEIISMFTQLQIRVLKDITKNDSFTQYNNSNILFSGLKISGSAAYIIKDWLLYHATLLIKTNLVNMKNTLLAGSHSSKHRADSDFFPTTNLETLDVELWKKEYVSVISKEFGLRLSKRPLSQMERELNNKLTENMYSTDDWIVNKSRNDSFLYEL